MKKILPGCLRSILLSFGLLLMSSSSWATHIVGCDLFYNWVSGNTYKVTVILYGDCGPSSAASFGSLHLSNPQVCVFNGSTPLATLNLLPDAASSPVNGGTEITPVCPDSAARTQCTNTSFAIPGVKKFTYSANYTFTGTSSVFRFVFNSGLGPGGSAGRAAAITNLAPYASDPTNIQLIDTLNNTIGANNSPILTVVPTPFFCKDADNCYTPGALDIDNDSLSFSLISATRGLSSCGTVGGPVTYSSAVQAWPGQPITAATPLQTLPPPAYNFDPTNGQVCFNPNFLQRSVVVFNIREYRGGIFVGSSQREMTFLVLGCTYTPPTVTAPVTTGGLTATDATHFTLCAEKDTFAFYISPTESNPLRHITCTASGLPAGIVFSVTNNNTNAPTFRVFGNSNTMLPGTYNFLVTLRDDNCPLSSTTTTPYQIQIFPQPHMTHSLVSATDCINGAVYKIDTLGGTGSPWTFKKIDSALFVTPGPPADTIETHIDSVAWYDTLIPGTYYYTIYSNVSNQCAVGDTIRIISPPRLQPIVTFTSPTFCGKDDGQIVITNLNAGGLDTVTFTYGTTAVSQVHLVDPSGKIIINNLRAGPYNGLVVHYGFCTSDPQPNMTLVDPPFLFNTITTGNASKCGFCDGYVKIWGLHPNQMDTVSYTYTSPITGITTAETVGYYVGPDSSIVMSGACKGNFNNFIIHTAQVCSVSPTYVGIVNAPTIHASFDSLTILGCKGDTMKFTNTSTPASDLYYSWDFGDGTTSNEASPTHVYSPTSGNGYHGVLHITNTACIDSVPFDRYFDNTVEAKFSMTPITGYMCQQLDTVKLTNLSSGTSPKYNWYFGDGTSDTTTNNWHVYPNAGTYNIMLVANNFVPCRDTAIQTIVVDSITALRIALAGDGASILCKGQPVTMQAEYFHSGFVTNTWTISDGFSMSNVDLLPHAFEGTGGFTVNLSAKFRACPEQTTGRTFTVNEYPNLYIGPDVTICPGSNAIVLKDNRNSNDPRASWTWSTGERGPSITVAKPGSYVASVTIDGCTTSDTMSVIKDCYMDIPNVFTPNGDGVNDYFYPRKTLTKGLVSFKMNIYSRWGQLIYETALVEGQGWDGALNGVQQPGGVYIYSIDATYKDGQIEHYNGNITLLR